ncbi:hypothetical protein [Bacillus altitudinis]|uniref:hypothetical protein n=1 Tax=Bacillus altitudinis TaxID=293387 RepID=UPI0024C19556|nr:hypothetical protein [Bacillus altitudinis]WHX70454.1 hypothetical protein QNH40_13075 [Bacillus altitudinis]
MQLKFEENKYEKKIIDFVIHPDKYDPEIFVEAVEVIDLANGIVFSAGGGFIELIKPYVREDGGIEIGSKSNEIAGINVPEDLSIDIEKIMKMTVIELLQEILKVNMDKENMRLKK